MSVPAGIQVVVAIRPDLKHFNPHRVQDRIGLYARWEGQLHLDYPEIEWRLSDADRAFLSNYSVSRFLEEKGTGLSFPLRGNWPTVLDLMPGFHEHSREAIIGREAFTESLPQPLRLIWGDRPDLQRSYDIGSADGRIGFLRWWFNFGHKEYLRVDWRLAPELLAVDAHGNGTWPWPHVLSLTVAGRSDLPSQFAPVSEKNWFNGLLWWHRSGCAEFAVPAWSLMNLTPLRRQLYQRAAGFNALQAPDGACAMPLPYQVYMVWSTRDDLQQAFDLRRKPGCEQLLAWWAQHGNTEYAGVSELFADPSAEQPGLNIVGYARSVIGIAEDVRMAARSAQLAGVPHAVIDAPMPGPAKLDHSLESLIVEQPRWPVSLYCLPPTEIIRLGMEGGRQLLNSGTYNVGAWHWELPVWPEHLMGVIDSVDEIWVFSEFVRNAFAGRTDKTVRKMPLAVEVPAPTGAHRAQFGLPASRFHFLVMFDGNSWLSRKNPIAAVRAFKAAFGTERGVGLVIKAISLDRASAAWQALEAELNGDDRVVVIDRTMDRVELTQLMATCDAYVSLHRSEGFGRIIAEAMLLGLPTVVTNFSGNVDFCTPQTSFLVDGPRVALTPSDYIFYEDQYWCDPDVDQARQQMRRVFEHRDEARAVAQAARHNIQAHYSVEAVAAAYRSRLRELRTADLI